jgi:hypothetical protein
MAQSEDIMVDQGTDVQIRLECFNTDGSIKQFKRIDPNTGATITPFTATGKIKKSYTADSSTAISFDTSFLDLGTPNVLQVSLTNTVTETMKAGRYVYDIELSSLDSATSTTVVERILQGNLTVNPSVT